MEFRITGLIRTIQGRGAPGLRVRAYDKDLFYDDLLSTAVTNDEGRFEMIYTEKDFKELFEGHPEVYLVVFSKEGKLLAETKPIKWSSEDPQHFELTVDPDTSPTVPPSRKSLVELIGIVPNGFDADVGQTIHRACAVVAQYVRDGGAVGGKRVRFNVLRGPIELMPFGKTEIEMVTDINGEASVDVQFTSRGFGVVVAELIEDPRSSAFFRGHSDGMTHSVHIYSEPCITAESGQIEAKIVVLDRHDKPVTGANIQFEGYRRDTEWNVGEVKEIGNGEYNGVIKTRKAGCWELSAQDGDDHVKGGTCVSILPGPPQKIEMIGSTDARAAQPYGEIIARVALEDKYGNRLDPNRLEALLADNTPISHQTVIGEEKRFPIRFTGYGNVKAIFKDSQSNVTQEREFQFASGWLAEVGLVLTGSTFSTPVFWIPEPDRPVDKAQINIVFNADLTAFSGFKPVTGSIISVGKPQTGADRISIPINSEVPVIAEEFPDGIYIGTVDWDCIGEGNTCFTVAVEMSPETDPWDYCVNQKNEEANKKCICIHIIYKPGAAADKTKGETIEAEVESLFPSGTDNTIPNIGNIKECCPVIDVKTTSHEMTAREWANLNANALGGNGQVDSIRPEKINLNNSTIGKKDGCINVYIIPVRAGTTRGITTTGGPTSVIGPEQLNDAARGPVGAHEIVHALGVNSQHTSANGDVKNLMNAIQPHGKKLTKDQCETIWKNVGTYACS